MPDPNLTAPLIRRLLQLDTPVAKRIFELGLFLAFAYGLGWMQEHGNQTVRLVSTLIIVPCMMAGFLMVMSLLVAIAQSVMQTTSERKDSKQ